MGLLNKLFGRETSAERTAREVREKESLERELSDLGEEYFLLFDLRDEIRPRDPRWQNYYNRSVPVLSRLKYGIEDCANRIRSSGLYSDEECDKMLKWFDEWFHSPPFDPIYKYPERPCYPGDVFPEYEPRPKKNS